jgi:hypothetical protein
MAKNWRIIGVCWLESGCNGIYCGVRIKEGKSIGENGQGLNAALASN